MARGGTIQRNFLHFGSAAKGPSSEGRLQRELRSGAERRRNSPWERFRTEHGASRRQDVILKRGATASYSVCLKGFSHLPLEIRYPLSGGTYLFWDWNATTLTPPNYSPELLPPVEPLSWS